MNSEEKKVYYLQLLQEPISRMSSTSAIFKGFSAAVLAALATATMTKITVEALIIGLTPLVSFLALDVYYLQLERKLRYRYRQVIDETIPLDFKVNANLNKEELKNANASLWSCMKSPSVWMFYGPIFVCAVALILLKLGF